MKKIATVLVLLLTAGFAFAQSFTLSQKNVAVEGPNAGSKDALCTITNTSTDNNDTAFHWEIIDINHPSSWFVSFCDPKDCYTALNAGYNKTFYLKTGNSGPLKTTFDFSSISGSGSMKLVVNSVAYPQHIDTVTYTGSAWLTGLNDVSKNKSLACYPNPVKDQLTIAFQTKSSVKVDIYNILGSQVKSFHHEGTNATFYVGDLDKGVYFIRIKDGNNLYTKSFTKTDQ